MLPCWRAKLVVNTTYENLPRTLPAKDQIAKDHPAPTQVHAKEHFLLKKEDALQSRDDYGLPVVE